MKPIPVANRNRTLLWGLEAALIMSAVFSIQYSLGAYRRDLATHSDEPAHLVTGLMVHDYCITAIGSSPVPFAEEYYLHYPKVAIGHWPPGFYLLQTVWYLFAGVSKVSATMLSGLIAGATVCCLYRRLRRRNGLPIAVLTITVLLGQPLIRAHSILIMSDMAHCLFALLAVCSLSDFFDAQKSGHALAFAVWSVFAILTKPLGLSLALFVPLCAIVTGRTALLRNRKLLMAGALIAALTAPYYLWTWSQGLGLHAQPDLGHLITASARIDRKFHATDTLLMAIPVCTAVIAMMGCISLIPRVDSASAPRVGAIDVGAAFAWCGSTLLFLYLAPVFSEPRYFLSVLTGLMMLYGEGLYLVLRWIKRPWPAGWAVVGGLAVLSVCTAPGRDPRPLTGYAAAAENIPGLRDGRVMLISSNEPGEGAFIAERLLRDRRRSEFVLRASKVLATSNWRGGNYRPRFSTGEQLREYLDTIPVRFVVVDDYGYRRSSPFHHELLKKMLAETPEQFSLVGECAVEIQGRRQDGAIRIYENRAAQGRDPTGFELDMRSSLGRTLRFEP